MTSKEVTNAILKYCCPNSVTTVYKTRLVQRELMIPKELFENTLIDMHNKKHAQNYIGGIFSVTSEGCLFWNDGGYDMEKEKKVGDTYTFLGEVSNYGQLGGIGNIQSNIKNELANNEDYKHLKELILDLEEYEAADIKWKESLSELLHELHRLELADNKVEQKISESRIDRFLSKFKKLKEWVEVGTLPLVVGERGHKMIELWDNLKKLLVH